MDDVMLRNQLVQMLKWEDAHTNIDNALKDLPEEVIGVHVTGVDYSIWQLAEHIRLNQFDILDFCVNQNYKARKWPDDYWPDNHSPVNVGDIKKSLEGIQQDRQDLINLVEDRNMDLFKPFPHGDGQNLLREVMLVIDHTTYHTGQIILLRKILGMW